jgi:hypothetical protein
MSEQMLYQWQNKNQEDSLWRHDHANAELKDTEDKHTFTQRSVAATKVNNQ